MKWRKAPEELRSAIEEATRGLECERRVMFGFPAYFVGRNMFAGLFEESMFLRLSPGSKEALAEKSLAVAPFSPMPGRPMKDYQLVPKAILKDPAALRALVTESFRYTASLPAKPSSARKEKGPTLNQRKPQGA